MINKYVFFNNNNKKQRGAALITVLIIVFLITAIITNITVKNFRILKRLTNQKIYDISINSFSAAIGFGRAALVTSGATSQIDTLSDIWAQPIPKTKIIDDVYMSGSIVDEQGKFNLNDLISINGQVNSKVLNKFTNLLSTLNISTAMASSIAYYIAAPQFEGSILIQYTTASSPYLPAGKPFIDISELNLVKGMNPQWVVKLQQYVTAIPKDLTYLLPQKGSDSADAENNELPNNLPPPGLGASSELPVNVNTASAEVIAAKAGLSLSVAQRIVTLRTSQPFKTTQDILTFLTSNGVNLNNNNNNQNLDPNQSNQPSTPQQQVDTSILTVSSSYFSIHAVINKGSYEFKRVALVYRANRGGLWPSIIWQHPE